MPFPPPFSILKEGTLNLESDFSTYLGRYQIVDLEDESLDLLESKTSIEKSASDPKKSSKIKRSALELLIARTSLYVTKCKTKRTTEQTVFIDLINRLDSIAKSNNEEQKDQGVLLLLGALLHRYFRIIQEYDNYNAPTLKVCKLIRNNFFTKVVPKGQFQDVRKCTLFLAVRQALGLPSYISDGITKFKQRDLEVIDVVTRVTSLEVFQKNMLLLDKYKVPKYTQYKHFAEDKNFVTHLQEIIDEQKKSGTSIFKQFQAIRFIQSVVLKVEEHYGALKKELEPWALQFKEEYPDFSTVKMDLIQDHMKKHIGNQPLREAILDLLYTDHIQANLAGFDHGTFLANILQAQNIIAIYTVCGAYVLLLEYKGIAQLKNRLCQVLDIEHTPEVPSRDQKTTGVKFFQQFILKNPTVLLDTVFFGGKNEMISYIAQSLKALSQKQEPLPEEEAEGFILGGI